MTLQHDRTLPELHPRFRAGRGSTPAPRLRLKPTALGTGYADGAWWPRSRDLVAELPMHTAASPDHTLTAGELLAAGVRDTFDRTESSTARERWDHEGGHADARDDAAAV